MMTNTSPLLSPAQAYQAALENGFVSDSAQAQAVAALQNCYLALESKQTSVQGVYLYGPVGRGKTWLMDSFYNSLTVPAKRQHFHHFMRWVHQRLFQLTGRENPLNLLASELAKDVDVLCFDEFFVSDIGDAILLSGLVQAFFDQGLVLVATSNQHPDKLYENGFNRDRLLPAIEALKHHMQVLSVDGGQDHRLHPGDSQKRYWVKQSDTLTQQFNLLAKTHNQTCFSDESIEIGHLKIDVINQSKHLLFCHYNAICEQPLAAVDFISLCDTYKAIFLEGVPQLSCDSVATHIARGTEDGVERVAAGDRTLPQLSRKDDGVRRFIALVDECYDRSIPLYINADVPLHQLYTQGILEFAFRRTLSRLNEMQLARFQAEGLSKE
ncbi:cell division protein ZapE [Pseudoalteromonas sp. G4]|uniref:cell division protein ZapE n=1 Tax=Pseudoalteromonas sp. G4 TaxID=2992761 RepID=UPI00237E8AD4|nr:cell division protein ZapE [Pseudoalteromonas sp. G4]MDE3272065.1 cell division protein ZapE [Pseudoalteromonas sp. G4]